MERGQGWKDQVSETLALWPCREGLSGYWGKETRVAVAVLERYVVSQWQSGMMEITFFAWWILIMIYSSWRLDDALHVVPDTLGMNDEGLYGIVWQTKVERQGKGTRLAAAKVSMSGEDWMEDGWSAAAFRMDDHEGAGAGP